MTETILKYAPSGLRLRCKECIDSVPRQLGRANKRFMFNDVRQNGNKVGMREYADPIAWISSAGFVNMCPNLTKLVRPLTSPAPDPCSSCTCTTPDCSWT